MQIHAFINQKRQEFYNLFISFFRPTQENWYIRVNDLAIFITKTVFYHIYSKICGWNNYHQEMKPLPNVWSCSKTIFNRIISTLVFRGINELYLYRVGQTVQPACIWFFIQLKDGGCFYLNPETNSEDLIMDLGRGETDEDEITVHGEANEFHSKANVSIPSVQWKLRSIKPPYIFNQYLNHSLKLGFARLLKY